MALGMLFVCLRRKRQLSANGFSRELFVCLRRKRQLSANGFSSMAPNEPARYKARLVAKDFSQIPGIDYTDVYSPVGKHSSIHTFLSLVAIYNYELEQLDVKTAFLHGDLEEDIYMDQS
jgi:hypothetical protein